MQQQQNHTWYFFHIICSFVLFKKRGVECGECYHRTDWFWMQRAVPRKTRPILWTQHMRVQRKVSRMTMKRSMRRNRQYGIRHGAGGCLSPVGFLRLLHFQTPQQPPAPKRPPEINQQLGGAEDEGCCPTKFAARGISLSWGVVQ